MVRDSQGTILTLEEIGLKGCFNRSKAYGFGSILSTPLATAVGIVGTFGGSDIVIELGDNISVHSYDDVVRQNRILGRYENSVYRSFSASMDLAEKALGFVGMKEMYGKIGGAANKSSAAILFYALTSAEIRYPNAFADFDFNLRDILSEDFGFVRKTL